MMPRDRFRSDNERARVRIERVACRGKRRGAATATPRFALRI